MGLAVDGGRLDLEGGLVLLPLGRGRLAALLDEDYLYGLDLAAVARGAGALPVLRPAHPAEEGGVHPIPDVVPVGHLSREPDLERLDLPALAGGPALGGRGRVPSLPAQVGDVRVHLDGPGALGAHEREPEVLQAVALPGGAGDGAVGDLGHPADPGDVGLGNNMLPPIVKYHLEIVSLFVAVSILPTRPILRLRLIKDTNVINYVIT